MGGEDDKEKEIQKRTHFHITLFVFDKDLDRIKTPHQDPLVISIVIRKSKLLRVLVDTRAFIDIMYWDAFKNLLLKEEDLKPA